MIPSATHTVLVIDDEPEVRQSMRRYLEDHAFNVIEGENGRHGLELFRQHNPHVVLVDLRMPEMDGLRVLATVKNNYPDVPIIMVSGTGVIADVVEALHCGAWDYILKPITDFSILDLAIGRALERARLVIENRQYQDRLEKLVEARTEALRFAIKELEQRESVVRDIFDYAPVMLCQLNDSLKIIRANQRLLDHFQFSKEGILEKKFGDIVHCSNPLNKGKRCGETPECPECPIRKNILNTLEYGEPHHSKHIRIATHSSGKLTVQDMLLSCVRITPNQKAHILISLEDITEQKRAEAQIREQAELLRIASDAIIVLDLNGQMKYWNQGAERLFGWTAEQVQDCQVESLLFMSNIGIFKNILKELLNADTWMGELNQLHRNGANLVVQYHGTLVRNTDGSPKSVLLVGTDLTDKKKMEAQLLRAQRLESLGALAGGVAHDLNNILTPISMIMGLLMEENDPQERNELLEMLTQNVQRGTDIVRQLLAFGKGTQSSFGNVAPGIVLKEIHHLVKETFPSNITFSIEAPSDIEMIHGNATQLHQVLLNLLVNARDAMPTGGKLLLRLENVEIDETYLTMNPEVKPGRFVVFEVTDTGDGIPQEILERIFDPFFTTKEPGKGTGLGLSTVFSIAKNHGGFVRVESTPGIGSIFRVFFPAAATESRLSAEGLEPSTRRGNGELILVVEDEKPVLNICGRLLKKAGYNIVPAGNGTEAVAELVRHSDQIRLVLTDLSMPLMDGLTLIRSIRHFNTSLPILAMSGHHEQETELRRTFDDQIPIIQKPFTSQQLLTIINHLIEKS